MECTYRRSPSFVHILTQVVRNFVFEYSISSLYRTFKMTMRIENHGNGVFTLLRFSKAEQILPNGIRHIDGNRIMDELLNKISASR